MGPPRCRLLAAVLICAQLTACLSWRPVEDSPREYIRETEPRAIRVTDVEGAEVVVRRPFVRGDSVLSEETTRVAVPIARIQGFDAQLPDTRKTIVAILVSIPVALVALYYTGPKKF